MDLHCGDLSPCLSRKFGRLGILVCDLYLTYHTEHILIFFYPLLQQPHISEQLYIKSAQFIYNMYNSHNSIVQTCFMNTFYNSNSVIGLKIAYFTAKYRVNCTTSTRSTIMSSIRVTMPTEDQTVSINNLCSLLSARSDLTFIEGFNLIEMIDYVSTSFTFTLCLKKIV